MIICSILYHKGGNYEKENFINKNGSNGWNYFRKEYNQNSDASEYEIYSDYSSYTEILSR